MQFSRWKNLKLAPKTTKNSKFSNFQCFCAISVTISTVSVDWNVENVHQGISLLSCSLKGWDSFSFSIENVSIDTEIDKTLKILQFSMFYADFLQNFQQTPEIGMLERVNKQQMLSCMLSGTIKAVFQMKNVWSWHRKRKNLKIFLFSSYLFNYCHTTDRLCELEC